MPLKPYTLTSTAFSEHDSNTSCLPTCTALISPPVSGKITSFPQQGPDYINCLSQDFLPRTAQYPGDRVLIRSKSNFLLNQPPKSCLFCLTMPMCVLQPSKLTNMINGMASPGLRLQMSLHSWKDKLQVYRETQLWNFFKTLLVNLYQMYSIASPYTQW